MNRKFKHKKLGWVATKSDSEEYVTSFIDELGGETEVEIPLAMFTSSADWEEIVEVDYEVNHIFGVDYEVNHIFGDVIKAVTYLKTGKVWYLGNKTQFGTIEKFEVRGNKCFIYINSVPSCYKLLGRIELSELTEPKEQPTVKVNYEQPKVYPLFYTEQEQKLKQENENLKWAVKELNGSVSITDLANSRLHKEIERLQKENTQLKNDILELQKEANGFVLDINYLAILNHLRSKINKLATK